MKLKFKKTFSNAKQQGFKVFVVFLILLQGFQSIAQEEQSGEQPPNVIQKYGPRRQISTIVYCGLAGAVLGLSTLSFYGRPQDKLTNIPIGFGLGVVVGTIYMTYQAAANPDEFYREAHFEYKPNFIQDSYQVEMATDLFGQKPQPQLGYSWEF